MSFSVSIIGLAILVGALFLVVALGLGLLVLLSRKPTPPPEPEPELGADVSSLAVMGPPVEGPTLEFYGIPTRLAVVVVAPVGRVAPPPPIGHMRSLLDHLLPELGTVYSVHRPLLRIWPGQVSSQGFVRAFHHHLQLPGERGKGTPWSSVTGKFTAGGQQYLVGLVCCGDKPNGLGQVEVEHEGRWLDVVRVRSHA